MVAYIDLDPGQCEFTASGMISLVVVLDRNVYQEPGAAAAGKAEVPAVLKHLDANLPRGNFANFVCSFWRGKHDDENKPSHDLSVGIPQRMIATLHCAWGRGAGADAKQAMLISSAQKTLHFKQNRE